MSFLDEQDWTKESLLRYVGHMDQIAGIKLVEDGDGKGRGSRILQVWTGTGLCFHVLAGRGLRLAHGPGAGPVGWAVGQKRPGGDFFP